MIASLGFAHILGLINHILRLTNHILGLPPSGLNPPPLDSLTSWGLNLLVFHLLVLVLVIGLHLLDICLLGLHLPPWAFLVGLYPLLFRAWRRWVVGM